MVCAGAKSLGVSVRSRWRLSIHRMSASMPSLGQGPEATSVFE
jgi:hypothetical protein